MAKKTYEEEFGTRLNKERLAIKLSREALAEELSVSKSTVDKWEQGKHIPPLSYIHSIAALFNKPLMYFLQGVDNNMLEILDFPIMDQDAPNPSEYLGEEEALKAWKRYYKDLDIATQHEDSIGISPTWCESNIFLILINKITGEISAVRDYGKFCPKADDYLFKTNQIAIFTHQPVKDVEELKELADNIISLFNKEIENMKLNAEYPVFLTRHCGSNNYTGWSLKENKEIFIYDYKQYIKEFKYSESNIINPNYIMDNNKYAIIPPSRELISALGLKLTPEIWERKMNWDEWYPRENKESKINIIPDEYKELYENSINAINKARREDLGHDMSFAKLESCIYRLEKLIDILAPRTIIENEIELITEAYEQVKDIV